MAVVASLALIGLVGLGSVLSFNFAAGWHVLRGIPRFADRTFFDLVDYLTSNVLLPIGALLIYAFVGCRLPRAFINEGDAQSRLWVR
jgi:neurotransmitter:Na+ symporter, NSS family